MNPTDPAFAFHSLCLETVLENGESPLFEKALPLIRQLPHWHFQMLLDERRLEFYEAIIRDQVAGKVVLDVGAGSGILSWLALKYGAVKVIAVEMNPALQSVLAHFLKEEIEAGKVELIGKDALNLRADDFTVVPEIILHELFAADGFGEKVIPIIRHLKSLLPPTIEVIPNTFSLHVEPVANLPEDKTALKDFAAYPLSKLQRLMKLSRFVRFADEHERSTGPLAHLATVKLTEPEVNNLSVRIHSPERATHLRLRISLRSGAHTLDAGIGSHWGNVYFKLPDMGEKKEFRGKFEVSSFQQLQLTSVE